MIFKVIKNKLLISFEKNDNTERQFLQEIKENHDGSLCSDNAMYDFFEPFLENNSDGWEWIAPEDIAALTAAPIIGTKDKNDNIDTAFGFMDYAVRSVLEDLEEHGEVVFTKG